MSDAPTYEIRTVLDFLKVPAARRGECLEEFAVWLYILEASGVALAAFNPSLPQSFDWIDDGMHTMKATVSGPDGTFTLISGTMKGFGDE